MTRPPCNRSKGNRMTSRIETQSILEILDDMRGKIEELENRAGTAYLERIESKLSNEQEHNAYLNGYLAELEFLLDAIGIDLNRTYLQWELDAMNSAIQEALR